LSFHANIQEVAGSYLGPEPAILAEDSVAFHGCSSKYVKHSTSYWSTIVCFPNFLFTDDRIIQCCIANTIYWNSYTVNKKFWAELIDCVPLIRHGPLRKRRLQPFFYWCLCIRCHGNVFALPLPSKDRGIQIQTHWWEGFMKYAVEMGSGAAISIPIFIKFRWGIQKLIGGNT
jgi:hypothetical protein